MLAGSKPTAVSSDYVIQLQRELSGSMPMNGTTILTFDSGNRAENRRWDTPASIVTFSAAAQSLTKEQIALEVMLGKRTETSSARMAQQTGAKGVQLQQPSTTLASGTGPSLNDFLKLSAADQFYLTRDPDNLVAGMGESRAAAFKAAYEARTLKIQDVSEVPELKYRSTTTYVTGPGGGESASFEWDAKLAGEEYGPNCFMISNVVGAGVFVSW